MNIKFQIIYKKDYSFFTTLMTYVPKNAAKNANRIKGIKNNFNVTIIFMRLYFTRPLKVAVILMGRFMFTCCKILKKSPSVEAHK